LCHGTDAQIKEVFSTWENLRRECHCCTSDANSIDGPSVDTVTSPMGVETPTAPNCPLVDLLGKSINVRKHCSSSLSMCSLQCGHIILVTLLNRIKLLGLLCVEYRIHFIIVSLKIFVTQKYVKNNAF